MRESRRGFTRSDFADRGFRSGLAVAIVLSVMGIGFLQSSARASSGAEHPKTNRPAPTPTTTPAPTPTTTPAPTPTTTPTTTAPGSTTTTKPPVQRRTVRGTTPASTTRSVPTTTVAPTPTVAQAPASITTTNSPAAGPAVQATDPEPTTQQPTQSGITPSTGAATPHATTLETTLNATTAVTTPGLTVSVPISISADCSTDVGKALRKWITSLPTNTTVLSPANACYLINSGVLLEFPPAGLTIDGGHFVETVNGDLWRRAFDVIGGTDVTFENLSIVGPDTKQIYNADKAFQSGIELQGTTDAVISNVTTADTWGDGITLAPLRGGSDHMSGQIVRPVTNVTISNVEIDGTGRQGITFASVDGAEVRNVKVNNVAQDTFDFEADQVNEGARNVTIDGCTSRTANGGAFFADGGAGGGAFTGDVTVANCTMVEPQGGYAIVIENIPGAEQPRGPFTFTNDVIRCGASSSVACVELNHADVTLQNSLVSFPTGTVHEDVWHSGWNTVLNLVDNVVADYGHQGVTRRTSQVSITGGTWTPHVGGDGGGSTIS
jgi:hypothetical protein